MALTIGDNFSYQGSKPLDSRLTYNTIAEMASKDESTLYDGIMAYCKANEKTYQWKSTNEVDATLGKWREFESGASVTVDDELSDTSENPVQNAVIKEALDGKADLVDGKVPAAQLPSYVDDVLEYEDQAHFPATGEAGKIYVALDTNKTYRWSGSAYVEISESLALGETSSTAYRGDRGKIAYDDSQTNKAAIGDLTQLETTDKTDLVGAINEVKGDLMDTTGSVYITKPNTWTPNTEYNFGNGLYGQRKTGYLAARATANQLIYTSLNIQLKNLISSGGLVRYEYSNKSTKTGGWFVTPNSSRVSYNSSNVLLPNPTFTLWVTDSNNVGLNGLKGLAIADVSPVTRDESSHEYDIWVTYTK